MKMKCLMMQMLMGVCLCVAFRASAMTDVFNYQVQLQSDVVQANQPVYAHFRFLDSPSSTQSLWSRTVEVIPDANKTISVELAEDSGKMAWDTGTQTYTEVMHALVESDLPLYVQAYVYQYPGQIPSAFTDSEWIAMSPQLVLSVPLAQNVADATAAKNDFTVHGTLTVTDLRTDHLMVKQNMSVDSITAQTVTINGDVEASNALKPANEMNVQGRVIVKNEGSLVGLGAAPVGTIVAWGAATLPADGNWAFCDGNNGTPDLRGRFVVGVDPSNADYVFKKTGGADEVTVTLAQMPAHSHTYSYTTAWEHNSGWLWSGSGSGKDQMWAYETTRGITMNATGGGRPHTNLPPYIALFYIMRIK